MDSLLKTAIILGTARAEGNTHKLVKCYQAYQAADVFFLSDYAISMFDYEHRNQEDDFINLAKMLLHYDYLIFATPMYWYSMSGQMKVFFDRLSDLLTIKKEIGRGLQGKYCSVLATGSDNESPLCFEQPFILSANYLGMIYHDMLYCPCEYDFVEKDHIDKLLKFIALSPC